MKTRQAVAASSLILALLPSLAAQQRRPVPLQPDPRGVKSGCPSTAVPVTANSVAAASDSVEFSHKACAGPDCAVYTVHVAGDGYVTWHGISGVEVKGPAFAIIDGNAARTLIQRFADRGFWNLCNRYSTGAADPSDDTTTLSIAGHTRAVQDVDGAAPSWLRGLDQDLERTANTHPWRHGQGTSETFAGDHLAEDAFLPKTGVTDLMKYATLLNTASLVKWLETLPNVNERDSSGWTALMYATQAGPPEAITLLLRAGGDAFARTDAGETLLHAAVSSPRAPLARVRIFTAAGLDLNAPDNRGITPLMLACRHAADPNLIPGLLEQGADPTKRDRDGHNAFDYLAASGQTFGDPARYQSVVDQMHHARPQIVLHNPGFSTLSSCHVLKGRDFSPATRPAAIARL